MNCLTRCCISITSPPSPLVEIGRATKLVLLCAAFGMGRPGETPGSKAGMWRLLERLVRPQGPIAAWLRNQPDQSLCSRTAVHQKEREIEGGWSFLLKRGETAWPCRWLGSATWSVLDFVRTDLRTVRLAIATSDHACYGLGRGLQFAADTSCTHLTQEGRYADLRQPREVHAAWSPNHEGERHRES